MTKRELGIRERRKIYEDAICVVAQSQKLGSANADAMQNRAVRTLVEKQMNKCVSILSTVLGYDEKSVVSEDGKKTAMLVPSDGDDSYTIEKKKFEEIVAALPQNKELKETVWKAFVQRDQKASEKFNQLIA